MIASHENKVRMLELTDGCVIICIYIYIYIIIYHIQIVPGRAGGGSFRGKKNYKPKKEFAYRMCARRPTSALPKPIFLCAWPTPTGRSVWWWLVVFPWCVGGGDSDVMCSDVVRDVMRLAAR